MIKKRNNLKNKNVKLFICLLLICVLTSEQYFAKSLTVSLSATDNIKRYETGVFSSSIKYNGYFYTGYYNLEVSNSYKVDDITKTSFGASATTFSYVKNGALTSETVWSFSKSFTSLIPCTKKVNGTLYAVKKGTGKKIGCGTGSGHDIDENTVIELTIK